MANQPASHAHRNWDDGRNGDYRRASMNLSCGRSGCVKRKINELRATDNHCHQIMVAPLLLQRIFGELQLVKIMIRTGRYFSTK